MNDFDNAMWFFNIANSLFLVGSVILIISVIRNRNVLKGYGLAGPVMTFCALVCCGSGYALLRNWLSLLLILPTVVYWALVVFYNAMNVLSRHGCCRRNK